MIDASFDAPRRLLQFAAFCGSQRSVRQCFTKRSYESFVSYLSGMLLEHRRLSIQSIAAKAPLSVYGRLQYFVSESKWSTDDVNKRRLGYIQGKRALAATGDGDLIIDDSACPKPYARHTEAAEVQYAGIAGGTIRCNTFVAAVWANQSHYFPVQIATYRPQQCFPLGKDDPSFRSAPPRPRGADPTRARPFAWFAMERHPFRSSIVPRTDLSCPSCFQCRLPTAPAHQRPSSQLILENGGDRDDLLRGQTLPLLENVFYRIRQDPADVRANALDWYCRRCRVREVGVRDHQQVIGHAQADRRDPGCGIGHQVVVHDHESVRPL